MRLKMMLQWSLMIKQSRSHRPSIHARPVLEYDTPLVNTAFASSMEVNARLVSPRKNGTPFRSPRSTLSSRKKRAPPHRMTVAKVASPPYGPIVKRLISQTRPSGSDSELSIDGENSNSRCVDYCFKRGPLGPACTLNQSVSSSCQSST